MKQAFPENFLWGAAISSAQADGGLGECGKGLNVFDTMKLSDRKAESGQTASASTDIAADHFHHYEEDIALMKEMGFKAYRFTIQWSFTHPERDDVINPEAFDFYDRLIDCCRAAGIEPVPTLLHFDMPERLAAKYNGFMDRYVVEAYRNHVRDIVSRFKDKVHYWIPVNEVNLVLSGRFVCGTVKPDDMDEIVFHEHMMHNTYLAHAMCVNTIKEIEPDANVCGMEHFYPIYPATCDPADVSGAYYLQRMGFYLGFDIMTQGDYPEYYKTFLINHGINPVLPEADLAEMKKATGNLDTLAFSYYQSGIFRAIRPVDPDALCWQQLVVMDHAGEPGADNPYVEKNGWNWKIDPDGLRLAVNMIWDRYHKPIFIVENGVAYDETAVDGKVYDDGRIAYYQGHIGAVRDAVNLDGIPVIGYLGWSAIDFLSSHKEMRKRYGFIYINRTDDDLMDLKRFKKKSFYWYKKVIASDGADLENDIQY